MAYDSLINQYASANGLDPSTLRAFMRIESGGDPNAQTGSYKGLFQLSRDEFGRYGGGNIFDPADNTRAASAKLAAESAKFQQKYGRTPTAADLYMIHQQGSGGYAAHVANPSAPAWQNMYSTAEGRQKGPGWAKQAIWGNVPSDVRAQYPGGVDSLTSQQFMDLWRNKVDRFGGDGNSDMGKTVGSNPGVDAKYAKIWAALNGKELPVGQATSVDSPDMPDHRPGAVVLQQPAQKTQLPDLPPASLRKLADSLMAAGRETGRNARSPWEALASIAQTGVGLYGAHKADGQEKDYRKALTEALSGASDTSALIGVMIGSGDPELQKAGLTMKLQQGIKDPKSQAEIAMLHAQARKYDAEAQAKAEGRKDLTATELKALYGAEDSLPAVQGTIEALDRAKSLSPKTYEGAGAGTRAWIMNRMPFVDSPDAQATEEMGKLLSLESIQAMSANLKGATTDFELKKFENILSDPSTPQGIRDRTIDRMRALAQRKMDIEQGRINELRGTGRAPGRGGMPTPPQAAPAPQASGGYSHLSDAELAARLGLPAPQAPAQPQQAPQSNDEYLAPSIPGRAAEPEQSMWGKLVERVAPNYAQAQAEQRNGVTPMSPEERAWWDAYWGGQQ